jgi:hypothetical protein
MLEDMQGLLGHIIVAVFYAIAGVFMITFSLFAV